MALHYCTAAVFISSVIDVMSLFHTDNLYSFFVGVVKEGRGGGKI